MSNKTKDRRGQAGGRGKNGNDFSDNLPVSISPTGFVCQPENDLPEILQVLPAPPNLVAFFKEIDGSLLSEPVSLLALVRRFYRGVWLYSVEPLVMDDFGFTLADEFGNFHCLERRGGRS